MRARPPRSLKSRALQLLAQRDQSRLELRRKLLRYLQREAADAARSASAASADPFSVSVETDAEPPATTVDALLDWLAANGFLSDERFVESRVHAREERFGNLRIRSELAQHGVAAPPEVAEALAASELGRAAAVRERRFGAVPASPADHAAQARFLAGRGFSPEVVQRLLRQLRRDRIDTPPTR
ncbi:MAG: RecX family transcriptional regulator [Caldimonas sp.]